MTFFFFILWDHTAWDGLHKAVLRFCQECSTCYMVIERVVISAGKNLIGPVVEITEGTEPRLATA